jgi:hypothetical protein
MTTAPTVVLLEIEAGPQDQASPQDRQHVATLLGLSDDQGPDLRLQWCRVGRGPQGALLGRCPKGPAGLEAKVGDHLATQAPTTNERVFGSLDQQTTAIHQEVGLAWPRGHATFPADAKEGSHVIAPRAARALPVLPAQVQLGDAASDGTATFRWIRDQGGLPVLDSHRHNDALSPEALVTRGAAQHGTPSAPCARRCRSNGDDDQAESRQAGGGRPCSALERTRCPHGTGVRGSSHRMTLREHPRRIGPVQRGTSARHHLWAARPASERATSSDQEVITHGRPPQLRGLRAFRFAGAIRTLAQLLRRALHVVREVTSTLGRRLPVQR